MFWGRGPNPDKSAIAPCTGFVRQSQVSITVARLGEATLICRSQGRTVWRRQWAISLLFGSLPVLPFCNLAGFEGVVSTQPPLFFSSFFPSCRFKGAVCLPVLDILLFQSSIYFPCRGRQRKYWMDDVKEWISPPMTDLLPQKRREEEFC